MKLIVGLGNPGSEYKLTRNNIGFMVVDEVSESDSIAFKKKPKFNSHIGEGIVLGKDCCFVKPQGFMNLSGEAVGKIIKWLSIGIEDLLVVIDDIHIPFGDIKIKPKGSDAGHKGLRSIIECIGTSEFSRISIGIKGDKEILDYSSYVLSNFTKKEQKLLPGIIANAEEACECWVKEGIEKTMNRFNIKKIK